MFADVERLLADPSVGGLDFGQMSLNRTKPSNSVPAPYGGPPLGTAATEAPSQPKKKKKKKRRQRPIRINLANCKYEVLRMVQSKLGWEEVSPRDRCERLMPGLPCHVVLLT